MNPDDIPSLVPEDKRKAVDTNALLTIIAASARALTK